MLFLPVVHHKEPVVGNIVVPRLCLLVGNIVDRSNLAVCPCIPVLSSHSPDEYYEV